MSQPRLDINLVKNGIAKWDHAEKQRNLKPRKQNASQTNVRSPDVRQLDVRQLDVSRPNVSTTLAHQVEGIVNAGLVISEKGLKLRMDVKFRIA